MSRRESRRAVLEPITSSAAAEHPAAVAWSRAVPGGAAPLAITPLKPQVKASHKSGVYRLHGVGPGGSDVVAKRCRRDTAAVELLVCRELLPELAVSHLRYFDPLDEGPGVGFTWLFMEDGGDATCEPCDLRDVARWLAQVHVGAAGLRQGGTAAPLRDRGADQYRTHMSRARAKLLNSREPFESPPSATPPVTASAKGTDLLQAHLRLLERVEACWPRVCDFAAAAVPVTLAHGDFVKKNLRVRRPAGGAHDAALFVLDWETAGWGSAAADLASLENMFPDGQTRNAMATYTAAIRKQWPSVDDAAVCRTSRAGTVFRLLASIDWACDGHAWQVDHRAMGKLGIYLPRLDQAIRAVEAA